MLTLFRGGWIILNYFPSQKLFFFHNLSRKVLDNLKPKFKSILLHELSKIINKPITIKIKLSKESLNSATVCVRFDNNSAMTRKVVTYIVGESCLLKGQTGNDVKSCK